MKQIEEMAECCPYFWNGACTVDATKPTDCDLMCEMFGFMTSLENAGYRKQSEIAREIFEEIEEDCLDFPMYDCDIQIILDKGRYAELKKKYKKEE